MRTGLLCRLAVWLLKRRGYIVSSDGVVSCPFVTMGRRRFKIDTVRVGITHTVAEFVQMTSPSLWEDHVRQELRYKLIVALDPYITVVDHETSGGYEHMYLATLGVVGKEIK